MIQIAGAHAILAAFALAQIGALDARSRPSLALNLAGALVLAVEAYVEQQWGFLVLESAWSLVSAWGLLRRR